ncbi:DUF4145 domain-containing protein [Acinetobacter sp. ANC 4862]|jgi:ribosomal protein L33|uniref:DUF4145 domain-containing protein n=1 Tax=Acinetobacter sp. ANC 4862 TaxID=2529849 RepID=UPI00103A573E|nr:DUF4145 domain-containing protein [Acinetobacter sp. ANC 4862]TCH60926.1 DUF4145 domain-containing protein [Acinetobacter sp. ANC 4862]
MTQKYYPPTYQSLEFHCSYCNVYASQHWSTTSYFKIETISNNLMKFSSSQTEKLELSYCSHCKKRTLWLSENILYPHVDALIKPHDDMPKNLIKDFEEAISIVNKSPRGAAALLRLVIQKLMIELGEKGENINQDIASLVKKGLDPHIQQALDYCRVVGNNAVHPGEIKLDDSPDIANTLFEMINYIVEDLISRPKKIQERFNSLPKGALNAIEKRDETSKTI